MSNDFKDPCRFSFSLRSPILRKYILWHAIITHTKLSFDKIKMMMYSCINCKYTVIIYKGQQESQSSLVVLHLRSEEVESKALPWTPSSHY